MVIRRCIGRNIVANRPAPETDINADFTYVDGYDSSIMSPPLNAHSSQPKLFSLFRSKRSAEPSSVRQIETTITAGTYSGPKSPPHQSVPTRQQHSAPYQVYQQGVPQLLVTAPSRSDTGEYTDSEWTHGGDVWPQNPGQSPPWQTMNAMHQGIVNGSRGWTQNVESDAFQSHSYSAAQNSLPYTGWTSTAQRDSSPRRSPRLDRHQRSFDDHWAEDGSTSDEQTSWERRKSLPSIVKLPVTPTAPTKHSVNSASNSVSTVPLRRQVDTYVIENGVRKRVRYQQRYSVSVLLCHWPDSMYRPK